MGLLTAQKIFDRFGFMLNDESGVRWTSAEFLSWLSAGQVAIVEVRPDANATTASYALIAGTRQTLPAAAEALIDVTRNMGSDGATPGQAISEIDRESLDKVLPAWHTFSSSKTVSRYARDLRNPKVYWVFPPQPVGTNQQVELVHSTLPTTLTDLTDTIGISDLWQNALLEFCAWKALAKDIENQAALTRAQTHKAAFYEMVGLKSQSDTAAGASE